MDAALRRWPLLILLGVLPLLGVGLFARGYWTPDEPRELAIAGRMAVQDQKSIPLLAGQAFSEKPPLTYWLAGGCLAVGGHDVRIARIPNLFFALVGIFAIALLAHAMLRAAGASAQTAALAALGAGIAEGTMELTWQVQIWLASDAPLLLGVCIAMLGAWRGANASNGRNKFGWYALMHLGLLIGFFSKNAIAWIVPGLALAAWIVWERRWRELWSWELWAGFLLQAPFIAWWISAVAAQPDGTHQLKIFFVDNLLGRFLPIASEASYNQGHHNSFGKYLIELPPYLAPWLFLAVAAVRRAWTACREPGPTRAAWRFAVAIIVPNMLLLSAASTARGIYLAPVMSGWALLIGLWLAERLTAPDRLERVALWMTLGLLTLVTVVLPPGLVIAAVKVGADLSSTMIWSAAIAATIGLALLLPLAWRRAAQGGFATALWLGLGALSVSAVTVGLAGVSFANRWQDQTVIADVAAAVGPGLVLFNADETTVSVLDWHRGLTPLALRGDEALDRALATDSQTRVLYRMPDKDAAYREVGSHFRERFALVPERTIDIPHGRRFAIFVRSAR